MKSTVTTRRRQEERNTPKSPAYGVCPLCEKALPRRQLRAALIAEPAVARRQIQAAIQEQYPAWIPAAGACPACWESYRGVARVIHFMQRFQSRHGARGAHRARAAQP